jgi:integrase
MTGHVEKRGRYFSLVIEGERDPQTGERQRQRISTKLTKKTLAEEALRDVLSKMERGEYVQPSKETVSAYLLRWLDTKAISRAVSDSTAANYRWHIERHLLSSLGSLPLQKLTSAMIQDRYNAMLKDGYSSSTVRIVHSVVHNACSMAVRWGLLNRNPADNLELPRIVQQQRHQLTPERMAEFWETLKQSPYAPLILTAFYTGMRRGELLGLTWDDINLIDGVVYVRRQRKVIRGGGVVTSEPKSGRGVRTIPISGEVLKALRELRLQTPYPHVFCNSDGRPYSPPAVSHAFQRLAASAGFKGLRFHDLRHAHASILLLAGVHPKVVQERLGHSTYNITMNLYSHVMPTLQKEAATAFEQALAPRHQNGTNPDYGKQDTRLKAR